VKGEVLERSWLSRKNRYPVHTKPKNNQIFMYINLAISLSTDLGLDQQLPNMRSFNSINMTGLIENGVFTKEATRAYLGCYYLSSAYVPPFLHGRRFWGGGGGAGAGGGGGGGGGGLGVVFCVLVFVIV